MTKIPKSRPLVLTTVFALAASITASATQTSPKPHSTHPRADLSRAQDTVIQQGVPSELPPHISTLLGMTHEQKCPVLQGVLRSNGHVQGIDVSTANHNDIVLFVVNETTKDQSFYLTSPLGTLRKLVVVKDGVGRAVQPSKADLDAFNNEEQFWADHLAAKTPHQ